MLKLSSPYLHLLLHLTLNLCPIPRTGLVIIIPRVLQPRIQGYKAIIVVVPDHSFLCLLNLISYFQHLLHEGDPSHHFPAGPGDAEFPMLTKLVVEGFYVFSLIGLGKTENQVFDLLQYIFNLFEGRKGRRRMDPSVAV